jgi:cyclase
MGPKSRRTRCRGNRRNEHGTKDGYDLPITQAVSKAVSIPVVASGGAGNPQHMVDAILLAQADAVLAASIFHFGQYTIAQTKNLMAANGIPVRLA